MLSANYKRYKYIDSVRGWALLGVVLFHVSISIEGLPLVVSNILNAGNYGVQLFFIGSALTLFMSFESRYERDSHPILYYWLRRIFRIAPLFWFFILFYQIHYSPEDRFFLKDGVAPWEVVITFFFLHGIHPESINSVVPGGWSIAVEMMFYLFVPICYLKIVNFKKSVYFALGSLLISLFLIKISSFLLNPIYLKNGISLEILNRFYYYYFVRQFPVFTLGFVLFFLIKGEVNSSKIIFIKEKAIPIGMIFFAFFVLFQEKIILDYYLISISYLVIIWGMSIKENIFLNNKFISFIGKISFSGYLTHFIVIEVIEKSKLYSIINNEFYSIFALIFSFSLILLSTIFVSYLSYCTIERWGQLVGKKIISIIDMNTKKTELRCHPLNSTV